MLDFRSFPNFDTAAHAVLDYLHDRVGFDLWMITRTEGNSWIVLQAHDYHYGIKRGDIFSWMDSFCYRMVSDNAPRIAPCAHTVPAYATSPINSQIKIGAYIGVPLVCRGALFGTLCAVHPSPQDNSIKAELPLIELMAKLLSTILEAELIASEQKCLAQRAVNEAMHDELTELYNRRGWNYLLTLEEERCEQYGHPACIISIDLDGLKQINDTQGHIRGDAFIMQTAQILQRVVRKQDIVARLGGDEFAVLCTECNQELGVKLIERIQAALAKEGISASLGMAPHRLGQNLSYTYELADQAMYMCKRKHISHTRHNLEHLINQPGSQELPEQ